MSKRMIIFLGIVAVASTPATATEFMKLTQSCEEALALSAIPSALRDQASVYVWRDDRYVLTVSSGEKFHCLVERNHSDAIIPECVTESGKDTILQGIMFKTTQTAEGASPEDIADRISEMSGHGVFAAPVGPGINYMLSAFNYIYSAPSNSFLHVPPHTMFFAPGVTNELMGGSMARAQKNHGYPVAVDAGTHGYLVTFAAESAETADVEAHCSGQIDAGLLPFVAN